MKLLLFILAACCIFICKAFNNSSGKQKSYQQLIRAALMENYDRISGPIGTMSEPVNVSLNPYLIKILEVNTAQETLSLKQWFDMFWKDPNLQWDPNLYGGVSHIIVRRSSIWLPDIVIMGKISLSAISDKLSVVHVYSDGSVHYTSDQLATVSCQFDVGNFPYDTQNCSIQYASWIYTADNISLIPNGIPNVQSFIENDEWTLRSYTCRSQIDNRFSAVYYDIKITRKPNYYITIFIWPTFIINCLCIIGVFSPFNESGEREEKVTMGLTTLLTMAVILMIIAGDLPKSANVPLLGIFIMTEIVISSVSSICSVFIMHLHSIWMNGTPVPYWLLQLTCLAKKKCDSSKFSVRSSSTQAWHNKEDTEHDPKRGPKFKNNVEETTSRDINMDEHKSESLRENWNKVARRLDLILMVIFLVVNIIVCASLLVIGNSKLN